MTIAEATVRSAVLESLLKIPEMKEILSRDLGKNEAVNLIVGALFASPMRWAVKCYAEEQHIRFVLEQRARRA